MNDGPSESSTCRGARGIRYGHWVRTSGARAGAAEPIASCVDGAGDQDDSVAGCCRRAKLSGRGAPGRTPRWRYGGGLDCPLQPRRARGGAAAHGGGSPTRTPTSSSSGVSLRGLRGCRTTSVTAWHGTPTWSLRTLRRALRQAKDVLPTISTSTIWRTLHEAGLSWQKSRTWCTTGVVMRQRRHGRAVTITDVDAAAKTAGRARLRPRRAG